MGPGLNSRPLGLQSGSICSQTRYQLRYAARLTLTDTEQMVFSLALYISVNSYGHVETVSSPNHTFSWASVTKQLTSTLYTYFRL